MKVAIPEWRGRVSPVFDVAENFLLIEVENGREIERQTRHLFSEGVLSHIPGFLNTGARTLICGAISNHARDRLTASGVQVIGFVCGRIDQVLAAFLNGDLSKGAFSMPGCKKWRCQQEGGNEMPIGFGMGGRGGGGGGRMNSPEATGPGGFCVCLKCGEKVAHSAGQPCLQMLCPKCAAPMTRA